MEEEQCVKVIFKLLNEILNPNVQINESQVACLVKYLTGIPGDVITPQILNNILMTWLSESVSRWEENFHPNQAVLTLALNFSVFLSSNENIFLKLNNQDVFQRFIKLIKKALKEMEATPNVGYVRLISNFLKHKSGCEWIISSGYWTEIIVLTLTSQINSDFSREGCLFVSKLIAKSGSINLDFCSKIINLIIAPILDISKSATNTCDGSILQLREPSLNLATTVLENLLEERNLNIHKVILKVCRDTNLETYIMELKTKIPDEYATIPLTSILYILSIYKFMVQDHTFPLDYADYETFSHEITTFIMKLLPKVPISLYLKYCLDGHRYCEKMGPNLPTVLTKDGIVTSPMEQILYCQLYPCCYVSTKLFGICHNYDTEDEIRDYAITQGMKRALPQTFRVAFILKDMLDKSFTYDDAIVALKYFIETRHLIRSKESTIICLQMLIICLEDVDIALKHRTEYVLTAPGYSTFILYLVKTLVLMLRESDLNWQDIFGVMLLLQTTNAILQFQNWENEIYVYGLDLIGLAFSKHLTMNMALLTDQFKEEDYLEDVITLIQEKVHHSYWEVRRSAIDAIGMITKNVTRCPWWTTLLIKKNIPSLPLSMGFADENVEVRAASFRCLQDMAKIDELWIILQDSCNIYEDLSLSLYNEPAFEVRSEVATLLATVCDNQPVFGADLFRLYDAMSYCVIEESQAEVKIRALHFWKKIANDCLISQGMIDGTFPKMTFSKETRKIVVLDDAEIRRRLFKVLAELSENGCLAVLSSALQNNIEVQNTVMDVMKVFIGSLKKYKITEIADDLEDLEEDCQKASNAVYRDVKNKIFGRIKLSPKIFLDELKNFLIEYDKKPISVTEQLELFLEEILN